MSTADTSLSEAAPTPQKHETVDPVDLPRPFLKFPPFPKPPAGTTIMPFRAFKEGGIRVDPGPDGEEVDSYGIPTVPLRTIHAPDVCKTNTKRKRRAEETKARKKAGGLGYQRIWWEQWEDLELQRHSVGFNPNSPRYERLQAAAGDFTSGRSWPVNYASETGPKFIWDKFQRYIGLPETGSISQDRKQTAAEEDGDGSDDDFDEDNTALDQSTSGNTGVVSDRDLSAKIAQQKAMASNEEKLSAFFDSPERSLRIFLSSYAHERGYIWSDPNLDCMPRVLLFFVNFLLRSKVLPEVERSLRRSLDVMNLALVELPNTSKIGKAFPDNFSRACNACWGKMADGYKTFAPEEDLAEPVAIPNLEAVTSGSSHDNWTAAQDMGDNQPNNDCWKTDADGSAWEVPGDGNPWNAKTDTSDIPVENWFDTGYNQQSLMKFLGPSALPLTHKTGIVERSARRIKAVIPPNPNPPKSAPQAEGVAEPDAEAVEVELDKLFTKVVLSPMPVDWDGEECPVYSRPEILITSQGAIFEEGMPPISEGSAGPKPHNPLEDDITLLIEADESTVKLMTEGICIGGTWVQIARQGEVAKKKKGKSKKGAPNYWYLDEHALTVPSFWTVPATADTK